ncbi:histidine kinase [Haloarchaeobius baliensis]|uniref:histidine kinase n=1 Tax=Haloarchaeobius baliensis TaxID=1670458 RepID=UPI003F883810
MSGDGGRPRIGITSDPEHPVFSVVGDRLVADGFDVRYFDATRTLPVDVLDGLAAFVTKHTRPGSVRSLVAAERHGVPTWNSATGVQVCISRLSQLCALETVGFHVPDVTRTKPDCDYVAKGLYHWDDVLEINGDGDVYEPLLPCERVDYKYYTVHDGERYRTVVLRATSKLDGEKTIVGRADPVPEHVDRIETLMDTLGMRGIGVDLVRTADRWYAVDLNPCPGFGGTGLEAVLADSIASCTDGG